jgi:hypothetical protein
MMICRSMAKCATVLLLAQICTVDGLALQPPRDLLTSLSISTTPLAPTQIEHIDFGRTKTTTSKSTATVTPLYLPVTALPPDPLGIAQVSGFYGPGAWAAWFLTIIAAWCRILRGSEEKFDLNTWLFLLGMNWAAVDIFRGIHSLRMIQTNHAEYGVEFSKNMGSFGAAFTVVFWGTAHALLQTLVTLKSLNCSVHRLLALIIGLILPLIALSASACLFVPKLIGLAGHDMDLLPALYWSGMANTTHDLIFAGGALSGFIIIVPIALYIFAAMRQSTIICTTIDMRIYALTSIVLIPVSLALHIITNNEYWAWGFAPFCAFFSPFILAFMLITNIMSSIVIVSGSSVVYVFKAYLRIDSKVSESCFFMPCASQSIKEEDQMYALLGGLFTFLGCEVLPPVFKELRRRYRDRRLFVQQVEERLRLAEMRRRTTAALNP